MTVNPAEPVKLREDVVGGKYHIAPMSVYSMLAATVARVPGRTALAVKRNGVWVKWTYAEYWADILTVAKAFIKLGLQPHHSVAILGHNAPEWHISNIASILAGGLACGVYTTSSAEAVQYKLEHSRANILVLEDEQQLAKVDMASEHVRCVVQWAGDTANTPPGVLTWSQLLTIGRAESDHELTSRLEQQAVNMACMLVYTSGTTGNLDHESCAKRFNNNSRFSQGCFAIPR